MHLIRRFTDATYKLKDALPLFYSSCQDGSNVLGEFNSRDEFNSF